MLKRIGLLGGGQLARMLALKAHQLGHTPYVFAQNPREPAAQVTPFVQIEPEMTLEGLTKFFESVQVVTVESEFFDADLLAQAAKASKTPCYPAPAHLKLLQDRLSQKNALLEASLPTLPFLEVNKPTDLQAAHTKFGKRLVLKARRMGYDGYGTFIARKGAHSAELKEALRTGKYGFIAEPFYSFKRELALLLARSKEGSITHFPWLQTHQESSRCLWVRGPANPLAPGTLLERLKKFLRDIKYVGVMAFELFESRQGELFINEVAPRVHNSGHLTMDAFSSDQFQVHLESILGVKLQEPQPRSEGYSMYNLLGAGLKTTRLASPKGVSVHWYGKSESRKGRKMGHLNTLAETPEKALSRLKRARKEFKV